MFIALPEPLRTRVRELARAQRQDRLDAAVAVRTASDLLAAGVDAGSIIAVAVFDARTVTRADAEPFVRDMLRELGFAPLEEGEPPDAFPDKQDVEVRLVGLVDGVIDRETAARWAMRYLTRDAASRVLDRKVRDALRALAGADLPTTDRPYLYDKIDFRAWLADLQGAE